MIDQQFLFEKAGVASAPFSVEKLGLVGKPNEENASYFTFVDDEKFLSQAIADEYAKVILLPPQFANETDDDSKLFIITPDPRWVYYTLFNAIAELNLAPKDNQISETAQIDPTAVIAEHSVAIGDGTLIEAGAIVMPGVRIGKNTIVRAGAILGIAGFEHKRTSEGILSVTHDGGVVIGDFVEIGAGTVIAQGFKDRDTTIGDSTKLDARVFVAHGNRIGNRVLIAAGAVLAGSIETEDDVWIGPGVTVRDSIKLGAGARIGIGSNVLRNVLPGQTVIGNPAKPL